MREWMRGIVDRPAPIGSAGTSPVRRVERPVPVPGAGQVRVRVSCCGVCRTDLHLAEGDLMPRRHGVTPGHEVVGVVEELGEGARRFEVGRRVGVPWLASTCGSCRFCRAGEENLCLAPRFTGWTSTAGYADCVLVDERFAGPGSRGVRRRHRRPAAVRRHHRPRDDPIVDLRMLKDRNFAVATFTMFMLGFVLYGTTVLLPLLLQTLMGYTALLSGLVLSPGSLLVLIALPIVGRLTQVVEARWLVAIGLAITGFSLLHMAHFNLADQFHHRRQRLDLFPAGHGVSVYPYQRHGVLLHS